MTNDYPPKVGGIQNYLWELWRRLPAEAVRVYCTPHAGAVEFDARQDHPIERSPEPVLLPYPWLPGRIDRIAAEVGAELVVLDPAIPLGLIGPHLRLPYAVVLHGAEVTIPGRLPGTASLLRRVLTRADLVISGGDYALAEAERCAGRRLPSVAIPPGVDHERLGPVNADDRARLRSDWGFAPDDVVIAVVTRLVPRKGIHTLVEAVGRLAATHPQVRLVVGGTGRESDRLTRLIASTGARARLVGLLTDGERHDLYAAADLMVMPCNRRWGGLEQEGFGIVFLEAAAAGLPQIAGRSGGATEAVEHGITGLVVDDPEDPVALAGRIVELVEDPDRRIAMGHAARRRAVEDFDYGVLADRLGAALADTVARRSPAVDPQGAADAGPTPPDRTGTR